MGIPCKVQSNRVGVMYLGNLVETGPTEAVFAQPQHPCTWALLASVPRPDSGHRPPATGRRHPVIPPTLTLLAGVTVIELPHSVAIRYARRLLAALGARVLQAGAPDATGVGFGGAASAAYAAWLDAGKQRCADLAGALAAAADVQLLIAGPAAAQVQAAEAALQALHTPPLRLGLTWFAIDGPYRDWAGSDAVIQAMSGVAYATGAVDGHPLLPRGHAPQIVAGVTACIAALGALLGRRRGWAGRRLDVDVLGANLCFYESTTCSAAPSGDVSLRRGINRFTPTYPGGIYRTQDSWIGITALTPPQWAAFCDLIGQPALGRESRYQLALQRLACRPARCARAAT